MRGRTLSVACSLLAFSAGVFGWEVSQDGADAQRFKAEAAGVVVDVVVRDRGGQPVVDLRADEFEVYEDGVKQELAGMELVRAPGLVDAFRDSQSPPPKDARVSASASRLPPAGPSFVALVFDRLSPEARALAYKGALAQLETLADDDFVGVFLSDLSLITVQAYTNDRVRIRQAIEAVATRTTAVFDRAALTAIPRLMAATGDAHPGVPDVASAEFLGRPVDNRTRPDGIPSGLTEQTVNTWEALSRDRMGSSSTNGLLAVTSGLGLLPGRKTVVFFAEGLAIPDAVLPHFRNVVTTANRANVSIYTVDAAGLRVHSKDAETGRAVRALGHAALELNEDGSSKNRLWDLEANEDVLRKDPRTSLSLLAEQTGGFLVDNTNDLGQAIRRIDSDRRCHYLLTYQPGNGHFNGEWRTLSVKVLRRNVTVRARSGYLAVRTPATMPLFAHEGPALAALEQTPLPHEIPVRAAALVFPAGGESRLAVLAATSGAHLTFAPDGSRQTYRTDFTILARIRERPSSSDGGATPGGDVVRKASQPYRLSGSLAERDAAAQGDILFFRQPSLSPGRYLLEVVVHDALAERAGGVRLPVDVPPADALPVGSLVVVRRGERLPPGDHDEDNPLQLADVQLYPNIGEPVSKREPALTLLVTIGPGAPQGLTATLEIAQAGQRLAALPIALEAPDASARVRQLVQVPLAALSAGTYTLRLVVSDGSREATREANVTVTE